MSNRFLFTLKFLASPMKKVSAKKIKINPSGVLILMKIKNKLV